MSRTKSTTAAAIPAALPVKALRVGLALAIAASLLAFGARVQAQQAPTSRITVRPVVGALVATGDQHDALKNSVLVGGQASYTINPNWSILGAFAWSPSKDKLSPNQNKLDLYQYDLGIEGRLNDLTPGSIVVTRPYAALGAGGRTYSLRNVANTDAQTNALGYGAVGLDLDHAGGRVGLRLEARDNVTGFKGFRGELVDRKARNDVQFSAGLTFGF